MSQHPREDAVVALVAEGCSNKVIAHRIGVSESTVKVQVRTAMKRLGLSNRTQLAIRAHMSERVNPPPEPVSSLTDFGARVRAARASMGLTQAELASLMPWVGATDNSVHTWEAGRSYPRTEHLPGLARVLGRSVDWLITGKEHNPKLRPLRQPLAIVLSPPGTLRPPTEEHR